MNPTQLSSWYLSPARRRAAHNPRIAFRFVLVAMALGLVATTHVHAMPTTPSVPALGAHTLLVQSEGNGSNPAVSVPIDTAARGSSLLLLVGGYSDNESAPSDTYGNHWKPVGDRVLYRGFNGRFSARAFAAVDATGGKNQQVRIAKPGHPAGEISVPFVEIKHAVVMQAVAQNYPEPTAFARYAVKFSRAWHRLIGTPPTGGATITSGQVTTTGPATLVAIWWGESGALKMTAVPDHGFKVIDQYLDLPPNSGVQCAVAVKQVDSPGTYDVSWTGTPAQGAILWLFAFQTGH